MRQIVIKLCKASEQDKKNVMELIQSGLIKLGVAPNSIKLDYNLMSEKDAEITVDLNKNNLKLLKDQGGTTTAIPTEQPTDTSTT